MDVVFAGEPQVELLSVQGEVAAIRPAGLNLVAGRSLRPPPTSRISQGASLATSMALGSSALIKARPFFGTTLSSWRNDFWIAARSA